MEENSLYTVGIHLNHCLRVLGKRFDVRHLSVADLQHYVRQRSKQKGRSGRSVSPTTIKKELTSFSGVWRWAVQTNLLDGPFLNQGLRYPKIDELPQFQTWKEIETQISRGKLSNEEQQELWKCLFLTDTEIRQVLDFAKQNARNAFVYPMMVLAAHTGARRSELLRSEVHDFDFEGNLVRLRERKRAKGKRTTRSVPLSALARDTMIGWLKQTNGRYTFTRDGDALTVDIASDQFRRTFLGSKWERVCGWHVFRADVIPLLTGYRWCVR